MVTLTVFPHPAGLLQYFQQKVVDLAYPLQKISIVYIPNSDKLDSQQPHVLFTCRYSATPHNIDQVLD